MGAGAPGWTTGPWLPTWGPAERTSECTPGNKRGRLVLSVQHIFSSILTHCVLSLLKADDLIVGMRAIARTGSPAVNHNRPSSDPLDHQSRLWREILVNN